MCPGTASHSRSTRPRQEDTAPCHSRRSERGDAARPAEARPAWSPRMSPRMSPLIRCNPPLGEGGGDANRGAFQAVIAVSFFCPNRGVARGHPPWQPKASSGPFEWQEPVAGPGAPRSRREGPQVATNPREEQGPACLLHLGCPCSTRPAERAGWVDAQL